MNTSIGIHIPCNQENDQRRNEIRALKTYIGTYSWKARRALKDGRHMDAQKYTLQVIELKQQLEALNGEQP